MLDTRLNVNIPAIQNEFSWDWFEGVLAQHLPKHAKALRQPATEKQIVVVERFMGHELPPFVRQAYLRHDGCEALENLFLPGYSWLSLKAMKSKWGRMRTYVQKMRKQNPDLFPQAQPSWRDLRVRPIHHDESRIPLADSGNSYGIYIDLLPGPSGVMGQLIEDDLVDGGFVIASSLEQYFLAFGNQIARGELRLQSSSELTLRHGRDGAFLKKLDCTVLPTDTQQSFNWDWFERVLADHLPLRARMLSDGVSEEALGGGEQKLSQPFPPFLRQAYARHNGSREGAENLIAPQFTWMNVQWAQSHWGYFLSLHQRRGLAPGDPANAVPPPEHEREELPSWWTPHFWPVARSKRWTSLFVDLRHGQNGANLPLLIDSGDAKPTIYAPDLALFWLTFGNRLASGALCRINFPTPKAPIQPEFSWEWFTSLLEPEQECQYRILEKLQLSAPERGSADALLHEIKALTGYKLPPKLTQAYLRYNGCCNSEPPLVARTERWGFWSSLEWAVSTWKSMREGYAILNHEKTDLGHSSDCVALARNYLTWRPSCMPIGQTSRRRLIFVDCAEQDGELGEMVFELDDRTGRKLPIQISIEDAFLSYGNLIVKKNYRYQSVFEGAYEWHDQHDHAVVWLNTLPGGMPALSR